MTAEQLGILWNTYKEAEEEAQAAWDAFFYASIGMMNLPYTLEEAKARYEKLAAKRAQAMACYGAAYRASEQVGIDPVLASLDDDVSLK